ncbi:DUF6471 domain-containing protein [Breoghania sp.]|uniref:DUF6471 domain-containing protein n=1 Tax=Breoghania sp. TaxID=2065378 RepID=UPI002AABC294|nr:DUF6471 domain-containing protein [Breoghania sp.]
MKDNGRVKSRTEKGGKSDWEARAENLLKAELKHEGVTHTQLVEKPADIGVDDKEANVRNRLSRTKFSAAPILRCLTEI